MWNMVQCAVQGRGHSKTETPCQDKTFACHRNGVDVIALADGAGSAKYSHFGAECVTQCICRELSEKFDLFYQTADGVLVKKEILSNLLLHLEKVRKEVNCERKDLASTLLAVAVKGDHYIVLHIGDGVIGYFREGLKVASYPENGEFTNTTVFTTSKDSLVSMKMMKGELKQICGFVLMSDGAAESFYDKRKKCLAEVIEKVMQRCNLLSSEVVESQLLESFEQMVRQMTTDDCSMILMSSDLNGKWSYQSLTKKEKAEFLQVEGRRSERKRRIKRYERLLMELDKGRTLQDISYRMHLKPKYSKRYLMQLMEAGLVKQEGCFYRRLVRM